MSKLRVNLGTGSGTCSECSGKMPKGELRVGKPHSIGNDDWGRDIMAGVKYAHVSCFKCDAVPRGRSRPAAFLSRIRSRFEGYDALSESHQKIIRFIHEEGYAEDARVELIRQAVYCLMGCVMASKDTPGSVGSIGGDIARRIGELMLRCYESWPVAPPRPQKRRRQSASITLRVDCVGRQAFSLDVPRGSLGAHLESLLEDRLQCERSRLRMVCRGKRVSPEDALDDRFQEGDTLLVAISQPQPQ